jgi:hypothetical protein
VVPPKPLQDQLRLHGRHRVWCLLGRPLRKVRATGRSRRRKAAANTGCTIMNGRMDKKPRAVAPEIKVRFVLR